MKKLELTILRKDVLEHVNMLTAYEGKHAPPEAGRYEQVFTGEAEEEMILRYWKIERQKVMLALAEFDGFINLEDDKLVIKIDLPDNWDEYTSEAINDALQKMMAYGMAAEWFAMALPNKVGEYDNRMIEQRAIAKGLLLKRLRPPMKRYEEPNQTITVIEDN